MVAQSPITLEPVLPLEISMAQESGDWSSLIRGGRLTTGYGAWTAIATGLLLLILFISKRRRSWTGRRRLPPGPAAWPVIGNMHLLKKGGLLIHHTLANLAKEYGPLMTLQLGCHTAVVVTSTKMAKEIFRTQNHIFCSRPETTAGQIIGYEQTKLIFTPYGEHLRTLRRTVQMELLSNKRIDSFTKLREEEILSSVYSMLEACQEGTVPIDLVKRMSELSANNISRTLFGKSFFGRKSESFTDQKEFLGILGMISELAGMFVVGDFIPFLKRFDIGGYEAKMTEIAQSHDKFYSRILEEHRSNLAEKTQEEADFVDTLLNLPAKDALSDKAIKALISDIIFGGADTSSTEMSWTFAELMRHPEILKKAVEELDSVVGRDRLLTESDIPNLKYLQAVVKETFRLHPVAGLIPYEASEATVIDGYHIPAKCRVFVNNYAISRSPENWDNALEFIPERFLENSRIDVTDLTMIPFGSGRRVCIGVNFGLLMVQLTVGQMLHVCNWSLPPGMKPEDVDITEAPGISVALKNPLQIIATPRLAPSILNDYIASLDIKKD